MKKDRGRRVKLCLVALAAAEMFTRRDDDDDDDEEDGGKDG